MELESFAVFDKIWHFPVGVLTSVPFGNLKQITTDPLGAFSQFYAFLRFQLSHFHSIQQLLSSLQLASTWAVLNKIR